MVVFESWLHSSISVQDGCDPLQGQVVESVAKYQ